MIAPDSQRLFGSFDEQFKDLKLDSVDTENNNTHGVSTILDSSPASVNNNTNGTVAASVSTVPGSTFRSNTPLLGGRHPLSRTSSLIDSIGIQRAASPFSSMKEPFIPQSSGVMSSSFWHGDHPESRVSTPVQQHPLLQRNESSSSFSYAANLGVNLSTHSLAVDIAPLGTPTAAQSHVNLFPSSDIPPNMSMNGMSQLPAPVSVESSWRYIDTQGQIHGPFTTQMMSQWYIGGYFASTLQISRLGSTPETLGINDIFITLGELMTKLEKYETDPFTTFDKLHVQTTSSGSINLNLAPYASGVAATGTIKATENDIFKPLTHDNIWDMDGGTTSKGVDIKLASATTISQTDESHKQEYKSTTMLEKGKKEKSESVAKALLDEQEKRNRELKRKEEARLSKKQKQKEDDLLKKQKEQKEQKEKEALEAEKQKKSEKTKKDIQTQTEGFKTSKDLPSLNSSSANPAPWASKVKVNNAIETSIKNGVSGTGKKKGEPLGLQQRNSKEEKQKEELKSVLNWANKSSLPSNQTIDIKSQFQKSPKGMKESSPLKELEDPNFIEEQKKLWEKVQSSSKQVKSAPSASTTTSSWTTVTSKGKAPIGTVVSPYSKTNTSLNSSLTAKTSTTSTTTTFASMNNVSPRQEFIKWCKSQMKLNSGITNNNVLELLLSLPTGPKSKELIQETIYANSDVMDGRRFATEFIKRRVACEKQGDDPLSWNEALALSGNDDDGWEFQVVSKKKGRKH